MDFLHLGSHFTLAGIGAFEAVRVFGHQLHDPAGQFWHLHVFALFRLHHRRHIALVQGEFPAGQNILGCQLGRGAVRVVKKRREGLAIRKIEHHRNLGHAIALEWLGRSDPTHRQAIGGHFGQCSSQAVLQHLQVGIIHNQGIKLALFCPFHQVCRRHGVEQQPILIMAHHVQEQGCHAAPMAGNAHAIQPADRMRCHPAACRIEQGLSDTATLQAIIQHPAQGNGAAAGHANHAHSPHVLAKVLHGPFCRLILPRRPKHRHRIQQQATAGVQVNNVPQVLIRGVLGANGLQTGARTSNLPSFTGGNGIGPIKNLAGLIGGMGFFEKIAAVHAAHLALRVFHQLCRRVSGQMVMGSAEMDHPARAGMARPW